MTKPPSLMTKFYPKPTNDVELSKTDGFLSPMTHYNEFSINRSFFLFSSDPYTLTSMPHFMKPPKALFDITEVLGFSFLFSFTILVLWISIWLSYDKYVEWKASKSEIPTSTFSIHD